MIMKENQFKNFFKYHADFRIFTISSKLTFGKKIIMF